MDNTLSFLFFVYNDKLYLRDSGQISSMHFQHQLFLRNNVTSFILEKPTKKRYQYCWRRLGHFNSSARNSSICKNYGAGRAGCFLLNGGLCFNKMSEYSGPQ